jgi:RHS repeat-associated protein
VAYTYDAFGRRVSTTHQHSGGTEVYSTTYDAQGRVIAESSPNGTVAYDYDPVGRLTRTTALVAGVLLTEIGYTYDALGRLETAATVRRDGLLVDSDPMASGNQPETARYHYDLLGRLDYVELPHGVVEDYSFDHLDRLDQMAQFAADGDNTNLADNPVKAEYDYSHRLDGKRSRLSETFWLDADNDPSTAPTPHTATYDWLYDDAGRLISQAINHWDDVFDRTEAIVYDLVGNRTRRTVDWASTPNLIDQVFAYGYDANDRLVSELLDAAGDGTTDQTTTFGWIGTQQASQSVVQPGTGTRTLTFQHNLRGSLASVVSESRDAASAVTARSKLEYGYDPQGIRSVAIQWSDADLDGLFAAAELTSRTEHLIDHRNLTGYAQTVVETEKDAAGQVTGRISYTFGADEISQTAAAIDSATGSVLSSDTHTFGHDGHGSVRVLWGSAAATQVFAYSAFGQLLAIHDGSAARVAAPGQADLEALALTHLLYAGEAFDPRLGQQYLRARWYDPALGRFTTLDPFAGDESDPLSFHKYAYAHGDAVNHADPTGKFSMIGVTVSMGVLNGLRAIYNGTVTSIGEDILSTLLGTQVYLDPMGLVVGLLLEELGETIELSITALRGALPILEAGLFLEWDGVGSVFTIEEGDAIDWASSGMFAPDPDEAASTQPFVAAAAFSAASGTSAAVKALTRSLAKYPLKLIAQTGKRKLYAASHYMLGKYNRVKGIASHLWQRNHLSQDALFRAGNIQGKPGVGIPYGQGLTVNMRGAIADRLGHYEFHKHIDDWMEKFRGTGKFPTVAQYNEQMEKALVKGGFTPKEAKLLRRAAEMQQKAYGISPTDFFATLPPRTAY